MTHSYQKMNTADFANFGVPVIAYVKPIEHEGERVFELYSANGTRLDQQTTEYAAAMSARERNLLPVILH